MGLTSDDSLVTAMDLSPSLFKEDNPKFRAISFGETWSSIISRVAWNMVIDDDRLLLSIFAHVDSINPLRIDLVRCKQLSDSLRMLSEHA